MKNTNSKSSISKADSYEAIGDFWDTNDLSGYWDETEEASLEINIKNQRFVFELDDDLTIPLKSLAQKRGIGSQKLVNLLVRDKLEEIGNVGQ